MMVNILAYAAITVIIGCGLLVAGWIVIGSVWFMVNVFRQITDNHRQKKDNEEVQQLIADIYSED